ncbi:uncharacterized protein FPRO_07156 [Fusarium proliferatum ET1]|uniref:Uncharacterized protein n=1 Tax=Fusarium proliferatum (strain ET1) TaxID=1227346 RepID=A0A1L7VA64_FUSPR|nr:uncharacterized protein FPRO_07156 [Fusarium proliferatum ET1]CZR37653.1 uncharacterized protein FPRO_07156 [Fusarium proliferatum ET1]
MNPLQNPAVRCDIERQIITINLLSFLGPDPESIHPLIDLMKPDPYNFAVYIRNEMYLEMDTPLQKRGCTNADLQNDIEVFRLKRASRQGNIFLTLPPRLPEAVSVESYVLHAIKRRLDLPIFNPWADTTTKLIVACGVALSQRGQLIAYDQKASLADHCWQVLDDLETSPCATSLPNNELKEVLSGIKRIEHKLNVGFEDVYKQLLDIRADLAVIENQQGQICMMLVDLSSKEGSVGSCQQTADINPPRTPDDGQQVPISQLLNIPLRFPDSSHQPHEAPPMKRTPIEQPAKFD